MTLRFSHGEGNRVERSSLSAVLDSVQSVRGVLACEEHGVSVGCRAALMNRIGGDVDETAAFNLVDLTVDSNLECAFEHINPLLVGMTMRIAHFAPRAPSSKQQSCARLRHILRTQGNTPGRP